MFRNVVVKLQSKVQPTFSIYLFVVLSKKSASASIIVWLRSRRLNVRVYPTKWDASATTVCLLPTLSMSLI